MNSDEQVHRRNVDRMMRLKPGQSIELEQTSEERRRALPLRVARRTQRKASR